MTTSNDIPLAVDPINRAAHHRTDPDWLQQAANRPEMRAVLMQGGAPLMEAAGRSVLWLGPEIAQLGADMQTLFLGLDKEGAPVFAAELPDAVSLSETVLDGAGAFMDARAALTQLPAMEANLVSTARSLFEWHRSHPFCARCGNKSQIVEAGWKRECPNCGAEHFPRTDPVAIMLAVKGDKCLIGRQASWPPRLWSCLAGFVEPGETVEQAAARELEEEAGIRSDPATAEYLFCQPWPFPSSLMVGLILQAENMDFQTEQDELEEARWITREEARRVLAGDHPEIGAPFPFAVAHHILRVWSERG